MNTTQIQMSDKLSVKKCVICLEALDGNKNICNDTDCVDAYWRSAALYQKTHEGQVN